MFRKAYEKKIFLPGKSTSNLTFCTVKLQFHNAAARGPLKKSDFWRNFVGEKVQFSNNIHPRSQDGEFFLQRGKTRIEPWEMQSKNSPKFRKSAALAFA